MLGQLDERTEVLAMANGRSHGHDHGVTATHANRRRLQVVLAITLTAMIAQAVGAWISGSLSLLADAGHMLTDSAGVAIALIAAHLATRPATQSRTFGWQRAEVLAAMVNAMVLCAVGVLVIREALLRWGAEPDIQTGPMLVAAVVGALANLVSLLLLAGARGQSLNMRGAYLEVFGDLVGSAAVIVAGVVIMTTGWTRADAIASFAIGALILPRALILLKDVADVLLESTPRGVDLETVRQHITDLPAVQDVHDVHAWTITSGVPVLSAHVVLDTRGAGEVDPDLECATLDALAACLEGHFDVEHCTFQLEPAGHLRHETGVHR
ncbi:cation diffusion facilitator family transporter [Ruania halotolerans]|uniref:cation diffusion facilitator family transporter n=1 Tax=Ruania halotolerans TaxID=2897773 RepID=UPI001E2AF587|nr:cation diffusion facilitator family transporter [Ruania halotolerans]UFU06937.1 cation diffusion facilitator family transporter [Ruania halotolerans]